jgi:hypothetical protein
VSVGDAVSKTYPDAEVLTQSEVRSACEGAVDEHARLFGANLTCSLEI